MSLGVDTRMYLSYLIGQEVVVSVSPGPDIIHVTSLRPAIIITFPQSLTLKLCNQPRMFFTIYVHKLNIFV